MKDTIRVKLQVRMTATQLERLRRRAKSLGFNSVPAYVRYWAATDAKQADNQSLKLSESSRLALRFVELLLAQWPQQFVDADAALDHIAWKLRQRAFRRMFGRSW